MSIYSRSRKVIVNDIMPSSLRLANRGPIVARVKEHGHHFTVNPEVVNHPASRVGELTALVADLETASSNSLTRAAWADIETWAANWGVEIA